MPPPERPRPGPLQVPLVTARLTLEPLNVGHADVLFAGMRDPALYRYETDRPPATREALRARFAQLAAGARDETQLWLNWVPVLRADRAAIGYVQATVERDRASATIGYLVVTAYQRRGLGREAVEAMCVHLAGNGVMTVHAWIDVRNAASVALVEALCFDRVGTDRSIDVIGGARGYDHHYARTFREDRAPI